MRNSPAHSPQEGSVATASRTCNLGRFQDEIGYRFTDTALLELALTHSSWAFENSPAHPTNAATPNAARPITKTQSNERLEILGDAVLSVCVLHRLYEQRPPLTEGQMSQARSLCVRATTIGEVAARFGLGQVIKLGKGEDQGGGRTNQRLLGDALEALIAAAYLDGGETGAIALVDVLFADIMERACLAVAADETSQTETPPTLQAHS